jgi:hypothetical protein
LACHLIHPAYGVCEASRRRRNRPASSAGVTAIVVASSGSIRRRRSSAGRVGIPTYTKITPETNHTTNTAVRTMPAHRCV